MKRAGGYVPLPIFRPEQGADPGNDSLKEVEKAHITRVLNNGGWDISKAALALKIDRSTLYRKIKRYSIQRRSGP